MAKRLFAIVCLACVASILAGCGDALRTHEQRWPDGGLKERKAVKPLANGEWINHGPFTTYYEDGVHKAEEGNYVDGQLNGTVTHYYESGAKKAQSEWREGRLIGKWTYWDEKGRVVEKLEEPPQ